MIRIITSYSILLFRFFMLWAAFVKSNGFALNVLTVFICIELLLGFLILVLLKSKDFTPKNRIRYVIDLFLESAFALMLAGFGWLWMAFFWLLLHLFYQSLCYDEYKKSKAAA